MIKTLAELQSALKGKSGRKPLFAGIILWQGASQIDGAPIVAIANRIVNASKNEKTGHMVQTFIIRSDVAPHIALKTGQDESVCGNCKHRPILHKALNVAPCYVQVAKSVYSVYKAFKNGRYAVAGVDFDKALIPALFEGLIFRLGTYGDPAAIPFQVWRYATLRVAGHAGYSHQWQDSRFQAFKSLCMASVDSETELTLAHAMGRRSFRVRNDTGPLTKGLEIVCPASKEAGFKTNCAACKACGGTSAKAKVSIAIISHGFGSSKYVQKGI
jgi:hypothetical protein